MLTALSGILGATALVITAVSPIIVQVFKFLEAKVSNEQTKQRTQAGREAILYAEEWAANLLKRGSLKVDGERKLEEAVAYYTAKMPREDGDAARKFLRGLLTPEYGLGATGTSVGGPLA